jgi:hypothetical protein
MFYDLDPNEKHTLDARVTFALWEYRLTIEKQVTVSPGSYCWIETLVFQVYEETDGRIVMAADDGSTLIVEDDEDLGEDWLASMLIEARLLMPGEAE